MRTVLKTARRLTSCLAWVLGLIGVITSASGQITDYTTDDSFGTFYKVTQGGSSSVSIVASPAPVRVGSKVFKHTAGGSSKRAEIDGGFDTNQPTGTYWYGWSMYFPSSDWNVPVTQYIGQWRFSNLLEPGFSEQNCTTRACGVPGNAESGSGHHLKVVNGSSFEFTIRSYDPTCADCEGTVTTKKTFGGFVKDQWMDFVMQANWSYDTDGFIKIWRQNNNGGYTLVMEYYGRTWVRKFAAGSRYANQFVYKPNWTVGLYYSSDNNTRTMYSDNIRESTTDTGGLCAGGFNEINPDPAGCETAPPPTPPSPTNLTASSGNGQAALDWSPATGATTYSVRRSTTSGSGYVTVASGLTSTAYTDTGLTNGTTYYYVVTATNSAGTSPNSSQASATPTAPVTCGSPVVWQNTAFAAQTGTFTAEFDARPAGNNMDGVVGLSGAAASAYTGLAAIVQFALDGTIKVRNGSAYSAATALPYSANTTYRIRMEVNVPARTYTVRVTPQGGTTTTLATNYSFRTEQNGVTQLANRAISTETCGLTVTNFTLGGGPCTPTNLALNRPVTATGTFQTGNPPTEAVDGISNGVDNRWVVQNYPQSLRIDLGASYALSSSELIPYESRGYRYRIELSGDGTTYTTAVDQTAYAGGNATSLPASLAGQTGRYVRVTVTGCSGVNCSPQNWIGLNEVRVLGCPTPGARLAAGNPAPAESSLLVYPNPGTGIYQVRGAISGRVQVFSIDGRVVSDKATPNSEAEIDLQQRPAGTYLFKSGGQVRKIIHHKE